MADRNIDDQDELILYNLQKDARRRSSGDISEHTDLSSSSVRKRIRHMEEASIIKGYTAQIDYQASGYPIRMILFATAPIPERGDLVSDILEITGVVSVQELITGDENLLITVVGEQDRDITPAAEELMDMGLTITDEVLVRKHETSPFEGFAADQHPEDPSPS